MWLRLNSVRGSGPRECGKQELSALPVRMRSKKSRSTLTVLFTLASPPRICGVSSLEEFLSVHLGIYVERHLFVDLDLAGTASGWFAQRRWRIHVIYADTTGQACDLEHRNWIWLTLQISLT